MEKKTIGQFIATLRKANGMTQKQLAEKLNVTDKAVSRWERDESAPDLTLIPVIAEIFNVTSDELLRGEKQSAEKIESPSTVEKTGKQIKNLLNSVNVKLKIRGIISIGIAALGLIVAMICNFAFNRGHLGFMLACIFYIAAYICQAIFSINAFYSINNAELSSFDVGQCRRKLVTNIKIVVCVITGILSFTLPLIILPYPTYTGLSEENFFFTGLIFVVIIEIICVLVSWGINIKLFKVISKSEEEADNIRILNKLRIKYMFIAVLLIMVTLGGQFIFVINTSSFDVVSGKTFNDMDKFIEYMETPCYEEYVDGQWVVIYEQIANMEIIDAEKDPDMNESNYYEESAYIENIYNLSGETIGSYAYRNEAVYHIEYQYKKNGDFKSVTTYTRRDHERGKLIWAIINWCIVPVYIVEIIIVFKKYKIKKRALVSL